MKIYTALYRKNTRCLSLPTWRNILTEYGTEVFNIEDHDLTPSDSVVIDFIKLCHEKIDKRPHCFVFAAILKERFSTVEIYYDADHVITKIYGAFYDWEGIVPKGCSIPLREYGENHLINLLESTQ